MIETCPCFTTFLACSQSSNEPHGRYLSRELELPSRIRESYSPCLGFCRENEVIGQTRVLVGICVISTNLILLTVANCRPYLFSCSVRFLCPPIFVLFSPSPGRFLPSSYDATSPFFQLSASLHYPPKYSHTSPTHRINLSLIRNFFQSYEGPVP